MTPLLVVVDPRDIDGEKSRAATQGGKDGDVLKEGPSMVPVRGGNGSCDGLHPRDGGREGKTRGRTRWVRKQQKDLNEQARRESENLPPLALLHLSLLS